MTFQPKPPLTDDQKWLQYAIAGEPNAVSLPDPAAVASLLAHTEQGGTLHAWCRQPGHVTRRTVHDWLAKDPEFAAAFAAARSRGFDALADECIAIADDDHGDRTEKGGPNTEFVARSKLRITTRLRLLALWDPRRYGEMQRVALGGDPNGTPIQLSDVERAAKLKGFLAAAAARAAAKQDT